MVRSPRATVAVVSEVVLEVVAEVVSKRPQPKEPRREVVNPSSPMGGLNGGGGNKADTSCRGPDGR